MIETSSPCFYIIQANDEAAEIITSGFSIRTTNDISSVTVRSKDFANDIEPINELDSALDMIKSSLAGPQEEHTRFNPLFFLLPDEVLDEALQLDPNTNEVHFFGLDGNPFGLKITDISINDELIISGMVTYRQFDLPTYEEIIKNQSIKRLN